jgi:hypothetical protein
VSSPQPNHLLPPRPGLEIEAPGRGIVELQGKKWNPTSWLVFGRQRSFDPWQTISNTHNTPSRVQFSALGVHGCRPCPGYPFSSTNCFGPQLAEMNKVCSYVHVHHPPCYLFLLFYLVDIFAFHSSYDKWCRIMIGSHDPTAQPPCGLTAVRHTVSGRRCAASSFSLAALPALVASLFIIGLPPLLTSFYRWR